MTGLNFTLSKILQSVEMKVAPPGSTTFKSVRFYKLVQSDSATTKRPRLVSVQECDANPSLAGAVCKQATVFTYQAGADTYLEAVPATPVVYTALYVGDLNGDGMPDLIYRTKPAGSPAAEPPHWFGQLAQVSSTAPGGLTYAPPNDLNLENNSFEGDPIITDLDHDGRSDVAVPSGPTSYAFHHNLGGSAPAFEPIAETAAPNQGLQMGDFSGRGKLSILTPTASGTQWSYSYFPVDCSDGPPCLVIPPPAGRSLPVAPETNPLAGWSTFGADIDGDHAADLLSRGGGLTNRLVTIAQTKVPGADPLSAADWTTPSPTTLLASQQTDLVRYLFLDQNGDGLVDVVRLRQGESVPALIMNSGNGFAAPQPLTSLAGTVGNIALGPGTNVKDIKDVGARIVDYDGDHKDDILLVDNGAKRDSTASTNNPTRSNMVVLLSRGTGFEIYPLDGMGGRPLVPLGMPGEGPTPPDSSKVHNYKRTQVIDANGDGLPDIFMYAADGKPRIKIRQGDKADLLKTVTDGMGKRISITYRPMTDPAVYTQGTCTEPQRCATGTELLVRTHSEDNGRSAEQNTFEYHYTGQVYDLEGGGLLGFQEWSVTDKSRNTITTETFDTTTLDVVSNRSGPFRIYGKAGRPQKTVVTTSKNGVPIQTVTTENKYDVAQTSFSTHY
jgi:hypothetical protein